MPDYEKRNELRQAVRTKFVELIGGMNNDDANQIDVIMRELDQLIPSIRVNWIPTQYPTLDTGKRSGTVAKDADATTASD